MDSFTLEELHLADELMFIDDFKRLMEKHVGDSGLDVEYETYYRFKAVHKGDLYSYLKETPRSVKNTYYPILSAMIREILDGTKS